MKGKPFLEDQDGITGPADYSVRSEIELTATFFDKDGKQISFSKEAPAVVSFSSLNRNNLGMEYVQHFNGRLIEINGSSVTRDQGENGASAKRNNDNMGDWDTSKSPTAYIGAIAGVVESGNEIKVTYGIGRGPATADYGTMPSYWFSFNSDVKTAKLPVKPTEPQKPVEPKKPEPAKPVEPDKPAPKEEKTRYLEEGTSTVLRPDEKGTQGKKDISGYTFTKTDPKNDKDKVPTTIHWYKKTPEPSKPVEPEKPVKKEITKHFDIKTGKEIADQEDGNKPKKDIPGYRYVETKNKDGETDHYYEQLRTTHVDENGNQVFDPEDGLKDPKKSDEWEFVRTVKKPNGDIEHVYRKKVKEVPAPTPKQTPKKLPQTGQKEQHTTLFSLIALSLTSVFAYLGLKTPNKKAD